MAEDNARAIVERVFEFSDFRQREVLEIGCGDGRITSILSEHCKFLAALDPDRTSVLQARVCSPGVRLLVGSGTNLPFEESAFDLILFTLSLHHQNSPRALEEAGRVLRDNGSILVIEPVPDSEFEKICCLFQDETAELMAAQASIESSVFEIKSREVFQTIWIFEDKMDLCDWLSDYYGSPADSDMLQHMERLLGSKAGRSPLLVADDLNMIALGKSKSPLTGKFNTQG